MFVEYIQRTLKLKTTKLCAVHNLCSGIVSPLSHMLATNHLNCDINFLTKEKNPWQMHTFSLEEIISC